MVSRLSLKRIKQKHLFELKKLFTFLLYVKQLTSFIIPYEDERNFPNTFRRSVYWLWYKTHNQEIVGSNHNALYCCMEYNRPGLR
jgi:hypothetical protein